MTKIVNKLPVSAERLKVFRDTALKKMIAEQSEKIAGNLFEELKSVADKTFVMMKNKKVWFDRSNAAIYPKFEQFSLPKFITRGQPSKNYSLDFEGFNFVAMSVAECQKSFNAGDNPYRKSDGTFKHFPISPTLILTGEFPKSGGGRFFNSEGISEEGLNKSLNIAIFVFKSGSLSSKI